MDEMGRLLEGLAARIRRLPEGERDTMLWILEAYVELRARKGGKRPTRAEILAYLQESLAELEGSLPQ